MEAEIGLDGTGTLIDVGRGPGVLVVHLAPLFHTVIGIDPEPEMLVHAERHAIDNDVAATWIQARAEDLAVLELPPPRLVTFGQSIHWTDRDLVLSLVHELLEPAGAVALIAPSAEHGHLPDDPPAPPIPHVLIEEMLNRYLGWSRGLRADTYETSLERSPFGASKVAFAPCRADIVRNADEASPTTCRCRSLHPIASVSVWAHSLPSSQPCWRICRRRDDFMTGRATPPSFGRPSSAERDSRSPSILRAVAVVVVRESRLARWSGARFQPVA